jgi:hypothetical protein
MDLPEQIRIGDQLFLWYDGNKYLVDKYCRGPYGSVSFDDNYLYGNKFYSLKTGDIQYTLNNTDIQSVKPIDGEFMEFMASCRERLIINTKTFNIMKYHDYVEKYNITSITTQDNCVLSTTHMIRVVHYNGETRDLPSMEVHFKTHKYGVKAVAFKNIIAVFYTDEIVVIPSAKYTLHELPSVSHMGWPIRMFLITNSGKRTKAAIRDTAF